MYEVFDYYLVVKNNSSLKKIIQNYKWTYKSNFYFLDRVDEYKPLYVLLNFCSSWSKTAFDCTCAKSTNTSTDCSYRRPLDETL